ncbi:tRNA lysidine(34) synthetase TilS [Nitrosospira sp. Is2]|uniref:tRNA lysidine(34) synthetase TilS n=1 Tax=Nitrosospira sp. Is2 TaxID=3080532 RepID=UPI0029547929|nr:tRNA lysidine(34) synthetase TilS [Nitrosospira sp. Is2]WON74363.1 tRNA lysidine(34) synthetase TilS [Nitrosospira sp. Is2]
MASSRKLKSNNISRKAENVLREQVRRGNRLFVGLSGGVDSVVLLDLLVPLSVQLPFELSAIHVNHGISPRADEWSRFCHHLCRSRGVPLETARLKINREPGVSLEAAAREERYRIFATLKADYVVLAQHLDDQAETLMLQLLRGAGVKGLSAMPVVRATRVAMKDTWQPNSGSASPARTSPYPLILRPLLEVSRREIEDYAQRHALQWITDESNDDTAFDRNFLRHEFFPMLEKRFPSYRKAFLRASGHFAEASALLDELAEVDSRECARTGSIEIECLRKLSFLRAKNLLRYMFARRGAILPSAAKLEDILRQLLFSGADAKLHVRFGNNEIRTFRGLLHIRETSAFPPIHWCMGWHGEKQLVLAELCGALKFTAAEGVGISLRKLTEYPVTVRLRRGGEGLRPDCKRPRRSLKNLLQEAAMPPWERKTLPLLFIGEQLACVPGLGVDCNFQAAPGEQALVVAWCPGVAVTGQ